MAFFDNIFSAFTTDAAEKAAQQKKAGIATGQAQAGEAFGKARGAIDTNYAEALMPFTGLQKTAGSAFDLYGDITGAHGAEGQARGGAAFQADPGYQFRLDQALEAVNRKGFGSGMGMSGNTLTALSDRASQEASSEYGNWANRLMGLAGMAPGIAGQTAGITTGRGDRLAGIYGQEGDLGYRASTAAGEADAAASLDANRASGQFWNTLLGAADLATKAYLGPASYGVPKPKAA